VNAKISAASVRLPEPLAIAIQRFLDLRHAGEQRGGERQQ